MEFQAQLEKVNYTRHHKEDNYDEVMRHELKYAKKGKGDWNTIQIHGDKISLRETLKDGPNNLNYSKIQDFMASSHREKTIVIIHDSDVDFNKWVISMIFTVEEGFKEFTKRLQRRIGIVREVVPVASKKSESRTAVKSQNARDEKKSSRKKRANSRSSAGATVYLDTNGPHQQGASSERSGRNSQIGSKDPQSSSRNERNGKPIIVTSYTAYTDIKDRALAVNAKRKTRRLGKQIQSFQGQQRTSPKIPKQKSGPRMIFRLDRQPKSTRFSKSSRSSSFSSSTSVEDDCPDAKFNETFTPYCNACYTGCNDKCRCMQRSRPTSVCYKHVHQIPRSLSLIPTTHLQRSNSLYLRPTHGHIHDRSVSQPRCSSYHRSPCHVHVEGGIIGGFGRSALYDSSINSSSSSSSSDSIELKVVYSPPHSPQQRFTSRSNMKGFISDDSSSSTSSTGSFSSSSYTDFMHKTTKCQNCHVY